MIAAKNTPDFTLIPGALYVCNHSGGKDSQAMYLYLRSIIPAEQLVVIHAHLPGVEWEGTLDHITATISHEFFVVEAKKTFLGMVEHRGMWPSSQQRQCTSDLKRDPINSQIIKICNERGFTTVVNCMGLRAQDSPKRAQKEIWSTSKRNTNTKRTWYEWLPIHTWLIEDVFGFIAANDQQPHWAYREGMSRLSCCFCIMASKADLRRAAELNPALFLEYLKMERKVDHTFIAPGKNKPKQWLNEYIGMEVEEEIMEQELPCW
jgi:DNA sulfur modification protein DndC